MDSDRIEAYRITDFIVPMTIQNHPDIHRVIYEDGVRPEVPNVVDEYWIGVKKEGIVFACFRIHQMTTITWQLHGRVLPEYRREYSRIAFWKAMQWGAENIATMETLIGLVPKCFRDVNLFMRRIGFHHCGFIPESFLRGGDKIGIDMFSIGVDEILSLGGELCRLYPQ